MTWNGVSFYINRSELHKMSFMPEAIIRELTTLEGVSDRVNVIYPFKYPPNGWHSWQAIAAYKYQIDKIFDDVIFETLERKMIGLWTVTSLGKHFNDRVEFPKPYYPQARSELNSRLVIYAMRLHFKSMLYYESLFAMAQHFNSKTGSNYSMRDLARKTASIMKMNKESWKVQLTDVQKKESNNDKTIKAHSANKQKGEKMFQSFKELIPRCTKSNGKLDICLLMSELEISRAMVYKLKARL